MTIDVDMSSVRRSRRRPSPVEFRMFYAVTLPFALLWVVAARGGHALIGARHATHGQSIWEEAQARTGRIVPFLFMG